VSSSSFFGSLFNGVSLFKENENLKQENQKLLSQVAAIQSILQGNQAQSDVSTSCQDSGFNLVMAGVSGLDGDNISINKGLADGISEGMPVISQQGVLFGRVLKAYKNFSQIILISNKNSIVNVKIQQSDPLFPEINGVVKGNGGLNAYLDLIPISSEINFGDILVTSAIDKAFPKDLLVAKIIQEEKNDQKPFQQARIDLFFDVTKSDNLFVITNYKR
jgi:rod shape-determining protein MreC